MAKVDKLGSHGQREHGLPPQMEWLAGSNLPTDIKVWHPWPDSLGKTGEHFKCVGLMENFEYGGGETDPIRISAWVSANTKGSIASAITKGIKQTKFNFSFFIVDFDTEKKVWFDKAFVIYPFTGVQAALNTTNGAIQLFAGSEPQSIQDHLDIKLYRMEFEAVPQENKVGRLISPTARRPTSSKNGESWANSAQRAAPPPSQPA